MPYDEDLAARVRKRLKRRKAFSEKKMFGGIGFLLHGNMCCGVWKESLIVRVGVDYYEEALAKPGTTKFDVTGREMRGWVLVDSTETTDPDVLGEWVTQAVCFCQSLDPK